VGVVAVQAWHHSQYLSLYEGLHADRTLFGWIGVGPGDDGEQGDLLWGHGWVSGLSAGEGVVDIVENVMLFRFEVLAVILAVFLVIVLILLYF
jgi:hypothetical protein